MPVNYKRTCGCILPVLLLIVLPACGPGNPLGRRAVDGRITLDGSPLESGHIQFIPQESGGVAAGSMIVQGAYRLETLQGLPPGKYNVQIFSPQNAPDSAGGTAQSDAPHSAPAGPIRLGIERIPSRYNSATTLTAEVTASGSTTFDFDLTTKIPR